MDKQYLLGIDIGGSITKGCLFDRAGHCLARAAAAADNLIPAPERVERDAEALWRTVCRLLRSAVTQAGIAVEEIAAIGLTGYGNGICLVDEEGNAVGPAIVSSDDRGQDIVSEMRACGKEKKIYARTHQRLWSAQTGTLLVWLSRHEPERLRRARCFLGIKDYIRMKLTGEAFCEITEASSTGLMDIHTKVFEPAIFSLLGIEDFVQIAAERSPRGNYGQE